MSLTIESLLTQNGVPTSGLTPTLKIWEIVGISKVLALGPTPMVDVGDGIYLYEFTTIAGYDNTKSYVSLIDGGVVLGANERYQSAVYEPISSTDVANIVSGVWDEPKISHMNAGSTGEALNQIKSDTTAIRLDIITIMAWLTELLKYDRNKTVIDVLNKKLIIYEDDMITVFKEFYLRDRNGVLSVDEVCIREPI